MQHLKHDANFLKASTVDRVKKHLNSMDNEFKKKLKYAKLNLINMVSCCLLYG